MIASGIHAVTGAFGYSGRRIAARLLADGRRVRTLTNRPREPRDPELEVCPLQFDDPDGLAAALAGVEVLYNTYWVRFDYRRRGMSFSHELAVRNTRCLFEAARQAGVRRVVHVSIANPSEASPFPYFRGKAALERALGDSGLSFAILRPAVLFGGAPGEDILINNIAWMLRRLPIFGVFGRGDFHVRPIHVDDLAALAVRHGAATVDALVDAVGPERFTYRELVTTIAEGIGVRRPIVSCPATAGYLLARVVGWCVGDVVLTWDEISALMADLLNSDGPATGDARLTEWVARNSRTLGREYASELRRRRNRARLRSCQKPVDVTFRFC